MQTTPTPNLRSLFRLATVPLIVAVAATCVAAESGSSTEQELLAILRSDAPKADKAIACKKLAIHGSSAAVPDLAQLLPDEQLASWSRIALEAIPGPVADEALRKATESLRGKLLVGVINSIGVRADAEAVELLRGRLQDEDAQVASAAAVALGHIGTEEAAKALQQTLASAPVTVRNAVAEGCILCAERRLVEDRVADAVQLYDQVRQADVPKQRLIEATRGAILARGDDGIPLLMEQLRSDEKSFFQLGLSTAREFPGDRVDASLAAEMQRATPQRAALILQCMADREQTVLLEAVVQAAQDGPLPVQLAALDALERVGDATCVPALLKIAVTADTQLAEAARQTLANLQDESVDTHIIQALQDAEDDSLPVLLELVGQRRLDAVPAVVDALQHPEATVRKAAFFALGETVGPEKLSVLISQVLAPQHAEDAETAVQALQAASIRMPDREACAAQLAAAMEQASVDAKCVLLEILSEVGGTTALQTLTAAAKSDHPQLQDDASRLLGSGNSVDAAPFLLDLATTAPANKYRLRALRGYLGLAWKFPMPEAQRVEMCRNGLELASRIDERKLVLEILSRHPSAEGLKLALELVQVPELKNEATAAALVIARKRKTPAGELKRLMSGLETVELEIVKAEYGAGTAQKDVTEILSKRAGNVPLIVLDTSSYNESFGSDPAPGTPKTLRVVYRINGKPGESTFPENALIILPIPK